MTRADDGRILSVHTIAFGVQPARDLVPTLLELPVQAVGLTMAQLEAGNVGGNVRAVTGSGLNVIDIVEPSAFELARPDTWVAARDRLRHCLDVAAAVQADLLYVTTGPAGQLDWDEAAGRFVDAVEPVVAHARAVGVRLAVENTLPVRADIGFLHRVADALDLAPLSGTAVCADLFAAWTERGLRTTLADDVAAVALVQLADVVLGPGPVAHRAVPGDGLIPLARQLSWLNEAGYSGAIEIELFGERIVAEGVVAALRRSVEAVRALLAGEL